MEFTYEIEIVQFYLAVGNPTVTKCMWLEQCD